ncbi:hypothetical protein FTO90_08790 [Listeria monocytogenes]|nr:hypothetical protein [Listeria monocytogenes]
MSQGQWMINGVECYFWEDTARFNTKEEAIKFGIEMLKKYNNNPDDAKNRNILIDSMNTHPNNNEPVYTFQVCLVEDVKFPDRTDALLEWIAEDVLDDVQGIADDYLEDVTEEHQNELQDLIEDWAKRHNYLPDTLKIFPSETIDIRDFEKAE